MTNSHGWSCGRESEKMDISMDSQNPRNCEKCESEAEDLYDFDAHTCEIHMSTAEDESFTCNFWDNTFVN